MDKNITELAAFAVGLGQANQDAVKLEDGKPLAVVPSTHTIINLEPFLDAPRTRRGAAKFEDFASWCRYVNEHKTESTRIFAEVVPQLSLHAIIDFHKIGAPAWGIHTATFVSKPSRQWERWAKVWGQPMTQEALANFLEINAQQIVNPTAAAILEIIETLTATASASFDNKLPITDGRTKISYEQTVTVRGGSSAVPGSMELPRLLATNLPVFENADGLPINWRLRPTVEARALRFTLDTVVPLDDTKREAMAPFLVKAEEETKIKPFIGSYSIQR